MKFVGKMGFALCGFAFLFNFPVYGSDGIGEKKISGLKNADVASRTTKGANMLTKEQIEAYRNFYQSTRENPLLDSKTTLLVQMAVAMALGCYP